MIGPKLARTPQFTMQVNLWPFLVQKNLQVLVDVQIIIRSKAEADNEDGCGCRAEGRKDEGYKVTFTKNRF